MKNLMTSAMALALMAGAGLAADDVTLQLKWVTQAQFAGYFVAKDKGFYEEEGLNVTIKPGSCLAGIFGAGDIRVNSVHRQAIDRLGERLQVEAVAEDGTVEAVSVRDSRGFAVGVQWHPEYWVRSDDNSARIFRAFGDAVRAHARARSGIAAAAE